MTVKRFLWSRLITDIERELERQDEAWGGLDHDRTHTNGDWLGILTRHLGKLGGTMLLTGMDKRPGKAMAYKDGLRHRVVVLAALCVSILIVTDETAFRAEQQLGGGEDGD